MTDWMDLGPLTDFPEGAPVLRKRGPLRLVCVREGDAVHALDDRCPHQGYPLSQGRACAGVLTCEWHNWKFELSSGACLFGGEPVRRYATRVEAGRVAVDPSVDREREAARFDASLRAALRDADAGRALREGLRLGAARDADGRAGLGELGAAFAIVAADGAARAEYGFDHPLAMMADACAWAARGDLRADEALVLCATAVGETSMHLGPREVARDAPDDALDPARVAEALAAERRAEAEARVRALARAWPAERVVSEALLPFAALHVYDYGHGTIFLAKALELARRFPAAAEELLAAITVTLGWATAETALPPFAATRAALDELAATPPRARGADFDRARYEHDVLEGERPALAATLAHLGEGCDPRALLRATAHAAAVRVARFDAAWEARLDAEVGVLDVTHLVTYCEATLALLDGGSDEATARAALLAAGFVGKLRRGDAPAGPPTPRAAGFASLGEAARARDVSAALAIARDLDAPARRAAYRELAPFLALEAAVRPIFYAHTIKNGEALRRLEEADAEADGAYLEALLAYAVPRRAERHTARVAHVARKFLADGRPPETLY
jgi:nitrite reductase/ring-hydroxylating ferredoxin subunit